MMTPTRSARRSLGPWLAVILAVTSCPAGAFAQTDVPREELQQAREKFSRALALQTAGDWSGALTLLKSVAAVKETPHVRFNIALCEEQLGQLVQALGDYETALSDSHAGGLDDVAAQAEARLVDLRARIPQLTIRRGEGAAAASIRLNGVELGNFALGKARPVNPGAHVVSAEAPGYDAYERTLNLGEGQSEEITVTLQRAAPSPAAPAAMSLEEGQESSKGPSNWVWFAGGVGVAGLATSGLFYLLASDAKSDLDALCVDGRDACPAGRSSEIDSKEDRGRLFTTIGNIGLGVGVVGIGTAMALWLFDGSSDESPSPHAARLRFGSGPLGAPLGATLHGGF